MEVTKETDGKQIGLIAYLTVIGLIIAFVMNSEKKSDFRSTTSGRCWGFLSAEWPLA